MKYGLQFMGPRRRARGAWKMDLLMMAGMGVLVWVLTRCVASAAGTAQAIVEEPAEVPWLELWVLGTAGAVLVVMVWVECAKQAEKNRRRRLAILPPPARAEEFELWDNGNFVHSVGEMDEDWSEQRATRGQRMAELEVGMEDPLRDAQETMRLGLEELCRIVDALTVETCAARDLVGKVQRCSSGGSLAEEFASEAMEKLHLCIGCLGGLREALGETTDAEQRVFTGEGQP